jgi:DUF971 family protein
MSVHPTKLERVGDRGLKIAWNNGQVREYACRELRDRCPCATCREKHGGQDATTAPLLPVLNPAETAPLRIDAMKPVGNYAYTIVFSDGHDTGIYTFDLLLELGRAV